MNVTIVGAGVVGLSVATELADRGLSVTVLERGPGIGANSCSWWAGGMLAPWCERESAEEPVERLGALAIAWWRNHVGCVEVKGSLVVAQGRDTSELKRFGRRTSHFDTIDAAGIAEIEPDLTDRFQHGLYFAEEAHLDPRKAVAELSARLQERGVPIKFNTEVDPATVSGDVVVDCRGLAAREALADLRGVKGEMLLIRTPDVTLHRPVRLLHPRIPLYIVPRENNLFMVGATMIESGERGRISVRSMLELLGSAFALHPAFGEAEVVEIGVDARPAFPDNLPRIRRRGHIICVNGMYRHGFLLAPAVAAMTAEAILDETHIPEMMDEHSPERRSA